MESCPFAQVSVTGRL